MFLFLLFSVFCSVYRTKTVIRASLSSVGKRQPYFCFYSLYFGLFVYRTKTVIRASLSSV